MCLSAQRPDPESTTFFLFSGSNDRTSQECSSPALIAAKMGLISARGGREQEERVSQGTKHAASRAPTAQAWERAGVIETIVTRAHHPQECPFRRDCEGVRGGRVRSSGRDARKTYECASMKEGDSCASTKALQQPRERSITRAARTCWQRQEWRQQSRGAAAARAAAREILVFTTWCPQQRNCARARSDSCTSSAAQANSLLIMRTSQTCTHWQVKMRAHSRALSLCTHADCVRVRSTNQIMLPP